MPKYTENQTKAILHGGHDVLVSASAGSGKTTVLVERILHQLTAGGELSRMLIVTFTNAATSDMKLKIKKKLKQAFAAATDPQIRRHLGTQQALANSAPIMTLDAFCQQVVQQYYYAIDLEPGFRVLSDPVERQLLAESVWNDLVETELAGDHAQAFEALADNFSTGMDDSGLADTVFALVDYANTTPTPKQWLTQIADAYDPKHFDAWFSQQVWPNLVAQLNQAGDSLTNLLAALDPVDNALADANAQLNVVIAALQAAASQDTLDYASAQGLLTSLPWPDWRKGRRTKDEAAKAIKKQTVEAANAVKKAFQDNAMALVQIAPQDLQSALTATYPLMQTLSGVCLEFTLAFASEKASRHVQDFNDIAHHALDILHALDPQTGVPIAENFKASFDQVFVDEYQDINLLQESLLDAVSRQDPGNRFMVGDIKQSIYGFRLADPRLFLAKYQRFGQSDTPGERLVLAENFRSSRNVLDFTNLIFSQIMDPAVGDMAYDQDAQLKRATFNAPGDFAPETQLLLNVADPDTPTNTDDDDPDAENLDKATRQANLVIAKIQGLVNDPNAVLYAGQTTDATGAKVWQKRRIRYQDITLLVRGRTNNVAIQSAFAKAKVPIVVADAQNYFKTTELMTMLSLLRVIDNPKQEIALVAVLRSPLVGMSADQLALIRLAKPQASFDDAFEAFINSPTTTDFGERTQVIAKHFAEQIDALRDFARGHELVQLIWRIYDEFGYLDFVGGLAGGVQRQANLRALADRAASYEAGGFRGLFAFIHFIELMQKQNKDLASAVTVDPNVDAVSLMTIHGSKGLEFPVVFVMGMDTKFDLRDLQSRQILTPNLTGVQWLNQANGAIYPLPQFELAKAQKKRQMLAEEMRLLYVALTRAEQYLFLVANVDSPDELTSKWEAATTATHQVLPQAMRASARRYLDWIGMAIARLNDHRIETFGAEVKVVSDLDQTSVTTPTPNAFVDPKPQLDLNAWFDWQYRFEAATKTTGFQSVTEIKRAQQEDEDIQELVSSKRLLGGNRFVADFAQPQFLSHPQAPSATAIGTATHQVLQKLDWRQPSLETIGQTIDALVADQQLDGKVAAKIDQASLWRFTQTDLGQLIQANAAGLHREVAFSLLLPAQAVFAKMAGDADNDVLVHGMIDGYVTTSKGVVLFDYKTDHVKAAADLLPRYSLQLQLYDEALSAMQPQPVIARYLVALATGDVISVAKAPRQ
ncbi:helicase-exonuclease AddAB subunit AddA [Lacticaseibacillus sp. N501-2]|uniref:helicase-exonuclease AddAB subunit AddA n=1 Tax=Lacticaseibacillus salsurae TaxID=3367729 RepID=UPI0038B2E0E9